MHEQNNPTYPDRPPTDENFVEPELAAAQMDPPKRAGGGKGGMLGAAMVALGHIIEPSKVSETVQAVAEADSDEPDLLAGIDFGDLPPIG